tara:strand:+ start:160696 stop:161322 length:627 start_codon:yes stop_codon:yes gene_type:complete
MKKMNIKQMMRKSAGYTIDQTILIVAVIAILITLIIASVGWDLLNRTSGTKVASYLKQIEEANGSFYARQGVWPKFAVDNSGTGAASTAENYIGVLALRASLGAAGTSEFADRWKSYLDGVDATATGANVQVLHEFGAGGIISQDVGVCTGTTDGQQHYIITMAGMPLSESQSADEAIDGEIDEAAGRVTYDDQTTSTQTLVYCANLI